MQTSRTWEDIAKGKAIRGKIIKLDEHGVATVRTFFGSKTFINVHWLKDPCNGDYDTFYSGVILTLEEKMTALKEELSVLENENKTLKDGFRIAAEASKPCHHHHCCCKS